MRYWGPLALASATSSRKVVFLDPRKEDVADGAVGCLHHRFRHPEQQLHLARHPLDILEQFPMEVFLGLRLDAPNDLQHHADHVVGHFHRPQVNKAGHQRVPNGRRMRPHLARILLVARRFSMLEDFEGDVRECLQPVRRPPGAAGAW